MDTQPVDGLVHELESRRKADRTRKIVYVLIALWLGTLAALVVVAWNAYFSEKNKALTLAQQVAVACSSDNKIPDRNRTDFGYYLSPEEEKVLCTNAKRVINQNDPELQEGEIQEPEIQEPEIQEPEIQNKEKQDPEVQDPEIQDPEIQDPEIDDPDPNDPPRGGTCTFSGSGTIVFTWETDNGTQTIECEGTQQNNPEPPAISETP
jgi:hypothetical protein